MHRINICLPETTLARLDKRVKLYSRSQWLNYAALSVMARLAGDALTAVDYERAARLLMVGVAPRSSAATRNR